MILAYLIDTYLRSKTGQADLSNLPLHVGKSMPFTGRVSLIEKARKLYNMHIQNIDDTDRNKHPIGKWPIACSKWVRKRDLNWKEETNRHFRS